MAQEFFSQVSEEIEGRVIRKISKEFSKTESLILGAVSKHDDFLLNPQIGNCSVAVLGTSRNSNSENREPTVDRFLDDHYPEVRYFFHHSDNPNSPEVEDYPHMVTGGPEEIRNRPHMTTGIQERIPHCPLVLRQENKRRRAPQVSNNFAVRTPLRQLKQTRFCWPFNN